MPAEFRETIKVKGIDVTLEGEEELLPERKKCHLCGEPGSTINVRVNDVYRDQFIRIARASDLAVDAIRTFLRKMHDGKGICEKCIRKECGTTRLVRS